MTLHRVLKIWDTCDGIPGGFKVLGMPMTGFSRFRIRICEICLSLRTQFLLVHQLQGLGGRMESIFSVTMSFAVILAKVILEVLFDAVSHGQSGG